MLITGSFVTNLIYLVDPTTGVSTLAPYAFPDGFVSAGDFLTLVMGTPSPVFRIHPDNTVSAQPAHWVTGHDGGTPQTAAEVPDHPGALPDALPDTGRS
ncbi:hypothetical protein [Kitasatospora purpeofusca]|uniref:hypothetical protein n=1 Tax=Kitasatospora purpeofusca TaxID=67352 RepID=UPI00364FD67D